MTPVCRGPGRMEEEEGRSKRRLVEPAKFYLFDIAVANRLNLKSD
jgi:hypothetical protein